MRISLPIMALLLLGACRTDPKPEDTGSPHGATDGDGDGHTDDVDCDDGDAEVFPGAEERCNGVDDDCDGELDEDVGTTWYPDGDGDGYAGEGGALLACEAPGGYLATAEDCDDDDASIHPGAGERCNGVDDDCDGEIDEDPPGLWYADSDGDGFGDADSSISSCDPGSGWVADDTDCDDGDAEVYPGAEERCNEVDDDCDAEIDEGLDLTWYADGDGDGFGDAGLTTEACAADVGWVDNDLDCDDSNAGIHPAAAEACDGIDNDCDGLTDDADMGVVDPSTWYFDGDADGYGLDLETLTLCEQPSGYAALGGDCDDGDPAFNPGAAEADCADPNDYNCDGSTGYVDDDGDGFAACEECDDLDAAIFPGADERCDGADNDCDGTVDEDDAIDAGGWCTDGDGDGYGDSGDCTVRCTQPAGTVPSTVEHACDDTAATVNPGAAEICNGIDDDCDALIDDDDDSITGQATWYADADSDGYGELGSTTLACDLPSGFVADATDCDDGDSGVHPAATELCDSIDNDCDGSIDEDSAADASTWYADADGDGYGDASLGTVACTLPSGHVADATDCDDGDSSAHPGATEYCDGHDDDCDGSTDEDSAVDAGTWYADSDGDGYGDPARSTRACSSPSGYLADATDCDDGDSSVHPGATETCSGVDDDCDGTVDEPAELLGSDPACGAVNCNEILSTRSSAPDGEYWLEFDGSSLEVFCDMTTAGGGWNVIHPDDMGSLGSLDAMRDEMDTAMAYLRSTSGALYYTELFQLSAYAAYDVDVSDYDSSRTRITFIPRSVAAVAGVTQGFTSNGSELTFTNCDANPNSYIEFWHTGDSYTWNQDYTMSLMWRNSKLPATVAVPGDYFTFTAIHQGGCGTHSTSPYWYHYDGMQDAALAVR